MRACHAAAGACCLFGCLLAGQTGLATAARIALAAAPASTGADVAAYRPDVQVAGVIRVWGQQEMSPVVTAWASGFASFQPQAKVLMHLMGSATAIPGLYGGLADLALLGREANITDINGFGRVKQYAPLRLELMSGSLASPGQSSALAVFVSSHNPITKIALDQLAALFVCTAEHKPATPRRWGQLGATGEWANRPVHLYTFDLETGTGVFLRHALFADHMKLNWSAISEYRDIRRADGTVAQSAAAQILMALSRDPYGVAIAHLGYRTPNIKLLPVAVRTNRTYYPLLAEHVMTGMYPLSRHTFAFIDRPPGASLTPLLREFLRYVLSREGQYDIAQQRGYLPLSAQRLALEVERIR